MKRAIGSTVALILVLWGAGILVQNCGEDPEPHTAPPERDPQAAEASHSIVSDPELLHEAPFRITETARARDGSVLQNAPYVIVLSDGRYVFGYTDEKGATMALFTRQHVAHEVYFYEEAWSRLRALDAGVAGQ